jgi:hypothetical protein
MQVELNKLIDDLTQKFWNNKTFSKPAMNARESVLQTIKAYFIKKDLVIVSRVEYDRLLKDAANQHRLADLALAHRDIIIEERDTLKTALKEIYNVSVFDYDTMPEEARRKYREVVLSIADKALAELKRTSI